MDYDLTKLDTKFRMMMRDRFREQIEFNEEMIRKLQMYADLEKDSISKEEIKTIKNMIMEFQQTNNSIRAGIQVMMPRTTMWDTDMPGG